MARPTKAQIEAAALELAEADEARGLVSLHVPPETRSNADIEADAEQDLGEMLRAAFGSDPGAHAKIQIYKRDARTKVRAYCGDYTPDQFREGGVALVKQDFGAGDFEYRAYGGSGLITRGYFSIAEIKVNPAAAPAAQSDFARALETIAQGQAAILQALTQPRENASNGIMQTIEMMRLLKELAPAPAPAASLVEQLTALRTLKEFMRDEAPEPADPDNPMSMVGPLLDIVKTSIQNGRANAAAPASADASPAMLPTIAAPVSIQNAQPSPDDEMKFILDHVISQAKVKANPADVGRYLYEVLPDEALPLLRADSWRASLLALAPSLAFHSTWLDAVRADCLARFDATAAKG